MVTKAVAKANKKSERETKVTDSVTRAFQRLRDLIVQGQIAPGSWVVEAELAERMGLSRTPVRGALQLLQREGFIHEQKANGKKSRLRVAPLTKEDANELYQLVGLIEGEAAAKSASLATAERSRLCDVLQDLNGQIAAVATAKKVELRSIFELDARFHYEIVAASAGPRTLAIHNIVKPQIERYWRLYAHTMAQDVKHSVDEHASIVSALKAGNAKAAQAAILTNWQRGADRIQGVIDLLGERGNW